MNFRKTLIFIVICCSFIYIYFFHQKYDCFSTDLQASQGHRLETLENSEYENLLGEYEIITTHVPSSNLDFIEFSKPFRFSNESIPVLMVPVWFEAQYLSRLFHSIDFPVERLLIIQNGYNEEVIKMVSLLKAKIHSNLYVKIIKHVIMGAPTAVAGLWNMMFRIFPASPVWVRADVDVFFKPGNLGRWYNNYLKSPGHCRISLASLEGAKSNYNGYPTTIIDRQTLLTVGLFDENLFPAYFEDDDFKRRLAKSGCQEVLDDSVLFYHGERNQDYVTGAQRYNDTYGSRSKVNFHNEFRSRTESAFRGGVAHMNLKFGPEDQFSSPYNISGLNWSFWKWDIWSFKYRECAVSGKGYVGPGPDCTKFVLLDSEDNLQRTTWLELEPELITK